jgi:hypothetical protein
MILIMHGSIPASAMNFMTLISTVLVKNSELHLAESRCDQLQDAVVLLLGNRIDASR